MRKLLCALMLLAGCTQNKPDIVVVPPPPPTNPAKHVLSITPTPQKFDGPGITASFEEAAKLVKIIALPDPVDWWHLEGRNPETSKAFLSAQWQNFLIEQHGFKVFIQVGPRSIASLEGNKQFSDPAVRAAYKADVMQRYELYHPKFMNLGIEINALTDRSDTPALVSLVHETYDALKKLDPKMVVFVSFQYEGLLEKSNGWSDLDKFGFGDAVGVSSYPRKRHSSQFGKPSDLANDYYKQIAKHTKKPIIFAELGWSADPAFGGSLASQAQFLNLFFGNLTAGMKVDLVNWWFLYDNVGHGAFFNKMGLLDGQTGIRRPAWEIYQNNG